MAHAQKSDFFYRRNKRVHLNRWGRQFSRLLAAEVCASAVVMLDTPYSEVVWRVLATHSIRHCVPAHFNWSLPHNWRQCHASKCRSSLNLDKDPNVFVILRQTIVVTAGDTIVNYDGEGTRDVRTDMSSFYSPFGPLLLYTAFRCSSPAPLSAAMCWLHQKYWPMNLWQKWTINTLLSN